MSEHDHAEHGHVHDGKCCEHDHDDAKAHGHSHEHADAPTPEGPGTASRWLSRTQYKGLGKYLKPWGKPPTGTTFWVQIITTVVVIIISILKGVETTVEMVIYTGPQSVEQHPMQPMLVAGPIICALFAVVLGAGYVYTKYVAGKEEEREAKRSHAASEPKAAAKATPPAKDVEERKEAKREKKAEEEERRARRAAHNRAERAEELEKMEAALGRARQEILMQAESENIAPADTRARMWALEQEHAERLALTKQIGELEEEGEKERWGPDELQARIGQAVAAHKELAQMMQHQAKELLAIEHEGVKEGCLPAEVRRRVHARKQAQADERNARQKHMDTCEGIAKECKASGASQEETHKQVQQAAHAIKEELQAKAKLWMASERKARQTAQAVARDAVGLPPKVREMMLARVRVSGLKARPELNEKCGTVAAYKQAVDGKPGRLAVTIDGESVLLKMDNLTVVGFDDLPLLFDGGANDKDDEPPPLM